MVSPSSPIAAECPRRTERGIAELQRHGYEVVLGMHARAKTYHTAGTPEERASDLMSLLANPDVGIIMATIGGNNANEMLPHIDFATIRKQIKGLKLFVGYSDNTILLHALWEFANVTTIHGPSLLPQFGEYGGVHPFTLESF
ncbi:MAG: LD-carboxypeptidase, partial [Patescibacteria group bacterium]